MKRKTFKHTIKAHARPCMAREQINRGRLRAQIVIQPIEGGTVCIFCPAEVSERLYRHLTARHILSATPKRAMFGRYPQDELIVTSSLEEALAEVKEFVGSLPEICYDETWPLRVRKASFKQTVSFFLL